MRTKFGWLVVGVLAVAASVAIRWQLNAAAVLRAEMSRERASAGALAAGRAEHERLTAAEPAADELARANAEAAMLPQLRAEVAALRQQAEKAGREAAEKNNSPAERFAVGKKVPSAEWRNAGTAAPQAALETVLWAAASGDVDTFAKTITMLDYRAKKAAQTLWESLPEAMRAQYGSPEQLIAFLSVRDVPLGFAQVRQINPLDGWPAPAAQVELLLRDADGSAKDRYLLFMNPGNGWRLVVTDNVVAKYAAQLRSAETAPAK